MDELHFLGALAVTGTVAVWNAIKNKRENPFGERDAVVSNDSWGEKVQTCSRIFHSRRYAPQSSL